MNDFRMRLQSLALRYEALTLRERVMVAAAVLGLLIAAWKMLLMDPLDRTSERMRTELRGVRTQISAQDEQTQALLRRQASDPDAENRARLAGLQTQSAALDAQLRERLGGLIEPGQMARVLEEVLTRKTRLELVRIESLPPEPLVQVEPGRAAPAGVYRHGMVLEFRGAYLDTLGYLEELAELPWTLYWDGVTLEVEDHPRAKVTLRVFTLGLREGWIGV